MDELIYYVFVRHFYLFFFEFLGLRKIKGVFNDLRLLNDFVPYGILGVYIIIISEDNTDSV